MANTIEILINAKDAASSVIGSIGNSAKDLGDSLKSTGTSLTAIGLPFLGIATAAIKSYSDSQAGLAQLDAVLKSTGGAAGVTRDVALDLASSLQKVTKFSDETVLSSENMLLTFTNIGKDVFPQATKTVLDMSQALGQDTKTSAIQLGKALNAPIEGTSALAKIGVKFTEAQKDMIKTMTESGNVAGAQTIILKELATEFGGSAEAAGKTFAGQAIILKNRLDDLMEGIGEKLIPIVTQLIGWVEKGVTWFENLDDGTKNIIVGVIAFGSALAIIGPIIAAIGVGIAAIASPIGLIIAAVAGLGVAFATNLGGIRDKLQPVIDMLGKAFSAIKVVIAGVMNILGGNDVGGYTNVFDYLFGDGVAGGSGIEYILASFGIVGDSVGMFVDRVRLFLLSMADFVQNTVIPAIQKLADWFIRDALPAVINFVGNVVLPALTEFFRWLSNAWNDIQPGLQAFANWFTRDALPAVVSFVQDVVLPGIRTFFEWLGKAWETIRPALEQLVNWFIRDALPGVVSFIQNTVIPGVNTFFDLLKLAWGIIQPLVQPIVDWFGAGGLQIALDWLKNTFESGFNAFKDLLTGAWAIIQPLIQPIVDFFITGGMKEVIDNIAGFITTGISNFITLVSTIWDKVKTGLEGLKSGLKTVFDWIKTNVIDPFLSVINGIINTINDIGRRISGQQAAANSLAQNAGNLTGAPSLPSTPASFHPISGRALGLDFVDRPQLALLHRGERVLTANENEQYSGGGARFSFGNITIMANNAQQGQEAADAFWGQLDELMQQNGVKLA